MSQKPNNYEAKSIQSYSSYTYDSPSFLVRFPHRKRNMLVSEAISSLGSKSWLDYGAGDGALVSVLRNKGALPAKVVLYEPVDTMRDQLIAKVGFPNAGVSNTVAWEDLLSEKYDLVTALEVLEHLPLPERIKFYSLLATTLEDEGKCLIELPVEYGPILLLKEIGRKFIKHRISEYSSRELVDTFFGRVHDSHLRYDLTDSRTFISPHRGFDLKMLLRELNSIGKCKEIVRSPFNLLPRMFNQAVLFCFELTVRDKGEIRTKISQLYSC